MSSSEPGVRLLEAYSVSKARYSFNPKVMSRFLHRELLELRRRSFQIVGADPLFQQTYYTEELLVEQQQDLVRRRLMRLKELGLTPSFTRLLLEKDDEKRSLLEKQYASNLFALILVDLSLYTKISAHFSLWGGSLLHLGTDIHHKKYLHEVESLQLPGCFALTELGHGSNVRGIETTAEYDKVAKEFTINTPSNSAQKYWIGNGLYAMSAVVFAQLIINGECKGVHGFIVPLRGKDGKLLPGVRVADCGHKMGINGVDNARFWFDNVRVPRENLLNRVANVTPEGEYESMIADNDIRFTAYIGELVGGRVHLANSSVSLSAFALTIAVRYALQRRQFGPSGRPETPIMDYLSHQRRLLPLLAYTYALNSAVNQLNDMYYARSSTDMALRIKQTKEVHILAAGLKSVGTWHMVHTIGVCREACGGQGYRTDSMLGILRADTDVHLTFEGDNHVLLQQVSKQLLKEYTDWKQHGKPNDRLSSLAAVEKITALSKMQTMEDQKAAFSLRLLNALQRLRNRVDSLSKTQPEESHVWDLAADVAADCGRAYIEREIFLSFSRDISSAPSEIKQVLEQVCSVLSLWLFTTSASFLCHGFISAQLHLSMENELNSLMSSLRPHALSLVDSFAIPKRFLPPLAVNYLEHNTYDNAARHSSFFGRARL